MIALTNLECPAPLTELAIGESSVIEGGSPFDPSHPNYEHRGAAFEALLGTLVPLNGGNVVYRSSDPAYLGLADAVMQTGDPGLSATLTQVNSNLGRGNSLVVQGIVA